VDSRRLYVSGTHNGVDFRAGIGTPVKTALSGVVWGTGNTDIARGCYSYGKWILIKHANGLTTIYGHLSQIKVVAGDKVITGDVIGYSGNTGYSTGPHLHFGVYATQGVIMEKYSQSKSCKTVVLPLADPKAYLNPMSYLPKSQ
jgi:murein DD-endopeptidase MepM/ murein hydrolase activator NlpD